jgi:hypothetical protein
VTEQREHTSDQRDAAERPTDLERTVDQLEERVLGHRVDQVRSEDDPEGHDGAAPAFEQDLDGGPATEGPTAEPS